MENSNSKPFGVLKIAAAYIGTVVGAGFASGQEVLRFFSAHGLIGLAGIAVSGALFFFIGYTILLLGHSLKAQSHMPIVRFANGALLGTLIDIIITVFLFGGLCTMFAGAGAIFAEQFALAPILGALAMATVTLLTVLTGTRGVVSAISYVVPFLIVAVLFISVNSLAGNTVTQQELAAAKTLAPATPNWLLSALTYASYNIVISIGVLAPIGAATPDKRRLLWGALLGALGLLVSMIAINFCLLANMGDVAALEVPMAAIAQQISPIVRIAFAVVLFAEVYTTAVGNLYAFSQRLTPHLPRTAVIATACVAALFVAQLGFSNMVRFLYPAVGYGGILFFGGVVFVWVKKRDSLR
jgi:uncharacterized membrane protein YkvI